MKIKFVCTVLTLIASVQFSSAQQSLNVTLFGELDPVPIRYSGSWGYTDNFGNEYALLGANTGLSVISINDSLNIQQLDFIPGPASNWREITVVNDFAYVTTEGFGNGEGMQVIDLSYLPDSVQLIQTFDSTLTTGHIIQRDASGGDQYIYVMGTSTGPGVHFIDISDPMNPLEVGQYSPYYIHDAHIRGDTLYACAIYEGTVDIIDISNKANPVLLQKINYPNPFTHSCWTSDDKKHLIVTDEIDGLPARIWNIEDFSNIYEESQFTANDSSLVHNPYVLGDFVFLSHNTEGLRVIDWTKKDVPVEVGYYDTYNMPSGGFHGLWSAYPYFPSGKIIGGNREDGLKIWKFNGTKAGRFYGNVTDSVTGNSVNNALVKIDQSDTFTASDLNGDFKFGEIPSGSAGYSITVSGNGYFPKTITGLVLNQSDSVWVDVQLVPISIGTDEISTNNISLHVFPIPAQNRLQIEIHSQSNNFSGRILLYSIIGDLVYEERLNSLEQTINIADFTNGFYLLRIVDNFGNISQTKVEINR